MVSAFALHFVRKGSSDRDRPRSFFAASFAHFLTFLLAQSISTTAPSPWSKFGKVWTRIEREASDLIEYLSSFFFRSEESSSLLRSARIPPACSPVMSTPQPQVETKESTSSLSSESLEMKHEQSSDEKILLAPTTGVAKVELFAKTITNKQRICLYGSFAILSFVLSLGKDFLLREKGSNRSSVGRRSIHRIHLPRDCYVHLVLGSFRARGHQCRSGQFASFLGAEARILHCASQAVFQSACQPPIAKLADVSTFPAAISFRRQSPRRPSASKLCPSPRAHRRCM